MKVKKKPKFERWMSRAYKRVKPSWRRPRGRQSKIRIKEKAKLRMPTPSYGVPKRLRYLHPSGLREVLIHNVDELLRVNPKGEVARIASKVGKKKRTEIIKKAEELKVRILNP
ncbi:MAG: 50S ribosomal protein L32e [Candidatus Aenigmarchaeota archaeon]|nr:50S ribosomal protein L32e [Candidatus Aenigmarchaeota archaeon]